MDTVSVNIVYRPMRIAFAIHSSDIENFRQAVRLNCAFWGGRFNPILLVDEPEAAEQAELFHPDIIVPMGKHPDVAAFVAKYPFWKSPFFHEELFVGGAGETKRCQILDIQNLLYQWRDNPNWKSVIDRGIQIAQWEPDDPLADAFLCQFGGYPSQETCGIDYDGILRQSTNAATVALINGAEIPTELLKHMGITQLTRFNLFEHYSSRNNWNYPGTYAGDGSNIVDLANYWNIRASGMSLVFFDTRFPKRYAAFSAAWDEILRGDLAAFDDRARSPAIWMRDEIFEETSKLFGKDLTLCRVGRGTWNGMNLRPELMYLGEESSLGILVETDKSPRATFALREKPFSADTWFHNQHVVASVDFAVYRSRWEQFTFIPPYVPELNEFASRQIRLSPRDIRLEPHRLGVIVSVTDHDISLRSIAPATLIEALFSLAGIDAKPSSSGLITRQLLARMGGADGARAFKIPGVRRLLKQYGPTASFTRSGALQLIASKDPESSGSFKDHEYLFIEQRPTDTKLTPDMVFSHLVEKGLFRIGADLTCPACSLASWTALDQLQQQAMCTLCGAQFDATRQLISGQYAYRRSGVLGLEKNTQGAIPVALVLQQLSVNLSGLRNNSIYSPSYDLTPKIAGALPICETDFVVLTGEFQSHKPCILIGECKDRGGIIDEVDIKNLRQIADAFPEDRFDVYVLLAKLAAFSLAEIELAKSLNTRFKRRVIMLTDRELEPYHVYERTNKEVGTKFHGISPKDLADATNQLYFVKDVPKDAPTRPARPEASTTVEGAKP